jgi:hypothetical protein
MSRHSISAVMLCGVLGWGLANVPAASASDLEAEQSQRGLRVTYLLYSGRPNPVVLVTDPARVRAIEERLGQVQARGEKVTLQESRPCSVTRASCLNGWASRARTASPWWSGTTCRGPRPPGPPRTEARRPGRWPGSRGTRTTSAAGPSSGPASSRTGCCAT